jgi:uncharacterized protein (TIGR02271 family)
MTNHSSDSPALQDAIAETEVIPLAEEELRIGKRQVATGKVRVSTKVDVVEELARATLDTETVEVTRVPIDRMVDQAPEIRTENDVTIIPILEEVLVVEKRLVLKEELHVRKRTTAEDFETTVQLRKQSAVIERIAADEDGTNGSE